MEEEEENYYYNNSLASLRGGQKLATRASRTRLSPQCRRICRKIPAYLFTLFVILATLGLIFYYIALRAKNPSFKLREVKVKNIADKNSIFAFVNTTLVMNVAIENKNFGRFEFENGTVNLLYGGDAVAEAMIKAGRVRGRGTARMNIKMDLTIDELSDCMKKNLTSDVNSGMLKLRSYGELRGRVYLMKIVNTSKVSVMGCSIWINVTRNGIDNFVC